MESLHQGQTQPSFTADHFGIHDVHGKVAASGVEVYESSSSEDALSCDDHALLLDSDTEPSSSDRDQNDESQSFMDTFLEVPSSSRLEEGRMQYGCTHYRRRCKIRAPCCNEIFDCRHCHNDAKNVMNMDGEGSHDLPRYEVAKVICALCNSEQEVAQVCIRCGVQMGEYFCSKCKFWDDDISKEQFHCEGCGLCRTGGHENFFHCQRCGCCYAKELKGSHSCIERAMHHNCPVCFEFLFDSIKDISVMCCGHTIHTGCLKEMQLHFQFACPVCSKSICDMSNVWERLDEEVAATPMPEIYKSKMVWILCNDCGTTSEVHFHVIGRKCSNCRSYNTRQIKCNEASSTSQDN